MCEQSCPAPPSRSPGPPGHSPGVVPGPEASRTRGRAVLHHRNRVCAAAGQPSASRPAVGWDLAAQVVPSAGRVPLMRKSIMAALAQLPEAPCP